ncbi:MAG: ABC transporter ATP-binding protein [Labilithrix sp.]|nr:ABC transporter ATP-binding protein [Labilithrix sp.]MCW5834435.1 ABC transporter ATP-binding protein [Labilithrix sp.]
MASRVVLEVDRLAKTFRRPFSGKKVEAVRGISLQVKRGEIFGFLGPNGAGKTTTIKMLTGLISPTSGRATILGKEVPSPEAMGSVGFLPENPYVYPYLTPREFVTLCGRLNGMGGPKLKKAVEAVIDRVGIAYAIDRPVRALSKGMLQRTGLAAALVHDPELLILDEPMSGLDPVGRKEVRDLIVEEASANKTIFFSSHILSDVEMLCDAVCILRKGEVVVSGTISELVDKGVRRSEITVSAPPDDLAAELEQVAERAQRVGKTLVIEVQGDDAIKSVLERALAAGVRIEAVTPKRETLEDIFVRKAL